EPRRQGNYVSCSGNAKIFKLRATFASHSLSPFKTSNRYKPQSALPMPVRISTNLTSTWPSNRVPFTLIHLSDIPTCQACEQEFIKPKPANYYSPRTLIHELLEALSFVRFRYVDVSLGIGRNIVRAIELTGPVSTASELANNLQ